MKIKIQAVAVKEKLKFKKTNNKRLLLILKLWNLLIKNPNKFTLMSKKIIIYFIISAKIVSSFYYFLL